MSTPTTIATPNLFLHLPLLRPNTSHEIIFFITGNPGLISYYHEFLDLLSKSPHQNQQSRSPPTSNSPNDHSHTQPTNNRVIAGFSLAGFESPDPVASSAVTTNQDDANDWSADELNDLIFPQAFQRKNIYGLRDQIEISYLRLTALVEKVQHRYATDFDDSSERRHRDIKVTLMGHSVGAYIALEMVRMHYSNIQAQSELQGTDSHGTANGQASFDFAITQTFLLTPTIHNIAHSPSGRIATPILSNLPFFPTLAQYAATGLVSSLPTTWLESLVSRITGMAQGSAALRGTVTFLKSGSMVRQALYLASEEMRSIGKMDWDEEIWGVLEEGGEEEMVNRWRAPRLYFWFAREDHWVADITREEIVRFIRERFEDEDVVGDNRRKDVTGTNRPVVVIDEDEGLVHAWCIGQSELVAGRVRTWLRQT